MSITPRPVLVASLLAAVTLLAGCGSEASEPAAAPSSAAASDSASASTSPGPSDAAASDAPACSEVWVADADLPRRYDGCVEGGELVAKDTLGCSSGQGLIRYDDHYYAVAGGLVRRTESTLDDDRAYREAVAICRG